jgi:hypothetical protein
MVSDKHCAEGDQYLLVNRRISDKSVDHQVPAVWVLGTALGERQVVTRRVHMSESWTAVNGARQDFKRWHGANIARIYRRG